MPSLVEERSNSEDYSAAEDLTTTDAPNTSFLQNRKPLAHFEGAAVCLMNSTSLVLHPLTF